MPFRPIQLSNVVQRRQRRRTKQEATKECLQGCLNNAYDIDSDNKTNNDIANDNNMYYIMAKKKLTNEMKYNVYSEMRLFCQW